MGSKRRGAPPVGDTVEQRPARFSVSVASRPMMRRVMVVSIAAGAAIIASMTLALSRRADTASWAARSTPAGILLIVTGLAVIAAGLRLTLHATDRAAGILLTAAGFAWFFAEWNIQTAGSPIVFTMGLLTSAVCPVLIGHGLLRYGARPRLVGLDRLAVIIGYSGTFVIGGLAAALFFAPATERCAACPANLLALQAQPALSDALSRAAIWLGPVWCVLLVAAIGRRLATASPNRRRLDGPALVPGIAYAITVGLTYLTAVGATALAINSVTRPLFILQAGLLALIAAGTAWPVVQRRFTRSRVARLVIDIAAAPPLGGLSTELSRSLRDPSFKVLYPADDQGHSGASGASEHSHDGTHQPDRQPPDLELVDALGNPAEPQDGQAVTRVVRGSATVAYLAHRPGLLDDPELAQQIGDTARLVLDNERLQARSQAQLTELRASRHRIVQAGDAERRRLERDLHDGAQQHLVALSLSLQLAELRSGADTVRVDRLRRARTEVTAALADLRVLARGIYPRELADEGLAAAFETLAESAAGPVSIESVPPGRYPHAVEATAFQVAAQVVRSSADHTVRIATQDTGQLLLLSVHTSGSPHDLVDLRDRLGAIGGRLLLDHNASGTTLTAELPCGW